MASAISPPGAWRTLGNEMGSVWLPRDVEERVAWSRSREYKPGSGSSTLGHWTRWAVFSLRAPDWVEGLDLIRTGLKQKPTLSPHLLSLNPDTQALSPRQPPPRIRGAHASLQTPYRLFSPSPVEFPDRPRQVLDTSWLGPKSTTQSPQLAHLPLEGDT